MNLLPCGDRAFLVELPDAAARRALNDALADAIPEDARFAPVVEHIPAARTVLVRVNSPTAVRPVAQAVQELATSPRGAHKVGTATVVEIPVRYDGEDLDTVAEHTGLSVTEVIARHTGQLWTVEFAGFMPGFGYLLGEEGGLTVPRRDSPRTRIPAGSVALAGDFTGIYPQASPGGWQLIGTTDVTLWDVGRTPPALLIPGARIRFVSTPPRATKTEQESLS